MSAVPDMSGFLFRLRYFLTGVAEVQLAIWVWLCFHFKFSLWLVTHSKLFLNTQLNGATLASDKVYITNFQSWLQTDGHPN